MQDRYIPHGDLYLRHRNPGAAADLIIPVDVICNVPDDVLYRNIETNSAAVKDWVGIEPAHNRPAIICGSGPSLADEIETIRKLYDDGADIYAINGAARYLVQTYGLMPKAQIIVDARPETIKVLGPAKEHLFASQVDPELFRQTPGARLWHLDIGGDMAAHIPSHHADYALMGGTASAGNVSLCLLYTLGYRDIHCFGYDSSHRETGSHAFEQDINKGEPVMDTEFLGKTYRTSLTMRCQADMFISHVIALEKAGVTVTVHGDGLLPARWRYWKQTPLDEFEAEKYRMMWSNPAYRVHSPADEARSDVLGWLGFIDAHTVIDFGCGSGKLTAAMNERFSAVGVDFAANCINAENWGKFAFVKASLWDLPVLRADAGVCIDVMEHIPTEKVDAVLANIASTVPDCLFRIEFTEDDFGREIGFPLHLTIADADWWAAKLGEHFRTVHAGTIGENWFWCSNKSHERKAA